MDKNKPSPATTLEQGFRLGEWRVYPAVGLLVRQQFQVHAEPKLMDVLLCLARDPHRVVSRDELLTRVWPRVVVNDEVVTRAVSELRALLGDTGRERRYIATIPKRGYQLLLPAMPLPEAEAGLPAGDQPIARAELPNSQPQATPPATTPDGLPPGLRLSHQVLRFARSATLLVVSMVLGAASLALWLHLRSEGMPVSRSASPAFELREALQVLTRQPVAVNVGSVNPPALPGPPPRLYVAPLEIITDTPQTRHFANGLDDDLRHTLAQLDTIQVVQGFDESLPQSDLVLTGSVRIHEQAVRVNLQLIDARDALVVWSRSYDCDSTDTMALQSSIARWASGELGLPGRFNQPPQGQLPVTSLS